MKSFFFFWTFGSGSLVPAISPASFSLVLNSWDYREGGEREKREKREEGEKGEGGERKEGGEGGERKEGGEGGEVNNIHTKEFLMHFCCPPLLLSTFIETIFFVFFCS